MMGILKDYLTNLAMNAKSRIKRGYYDITCSTQGISVDKLTNLLEDNSKIQVLTEIKFESPSSRKIRPMTDPLPIAKSMVAGGASAISVLTDPDNFGGGLENLEKVVAEIPLPVVMKDIIVSPKQLEAAKRIGAAGIVLISELFSRGLSEVPIDTMLDHARRLGLETILEANSRDEFSKVRKYSPDIYGINNRNLDTLQVDLSTTEKILSVNKQLDRPVISESGIESSHDILRLKKSGAHAFLVGTSIMRSNDIEGKVRELVNA